MPYLSKLKIYAIDNANNLVTLEKLDNVTSNPTIDKHYIVNNNTVHINVGKDYKSVLIVSLDAFKPVDILTNDILAELVSIAPLKDKSYEERVTLAAPIKAKIAGANTKISELEETYGELQRSDDTKTLLTTLTAQVDEFVGTKPSNTKNALIVFFGMFTPIILGLLIGFIGLFLKSKKKNKENNK